MVNFGPLAAEIGLPNWGIPANFNGFRLLASLLHRRRSPEANQTYARCLAVSWAGRLYIYFSGLLSLKGILPGAKFTLRQSLALSYIGTRAVDVHEPNLRVVGLQGTALRNFRRGRHLYSAGRPSRWAWHRSTL